VELSGQYEAERASGRKLKPGEVSSYWYRKAFEYIKSDPIGWLELTLKKAYFLANGHEIPSERQLYRIRDWSPVLGLLMVDRPIGLPFGLLFPLAAMGLFSLATAKRDPRPLERDGRRARAAHRLLALYLAVYALTVIGFFVTSRHRIPLVPALIPYAAFALVGVWEWVRKREGDLRRIVATLLVFLAAFALSNTRAWGVRDDVEAVHYLNLGLAYVRLDRYEDAVRELDAALEREPSFANAWFNKGLALLEMKRYDEAVDAFQRTLRIDPQYAPAWSHLGNVSFERGLLGVAEGYFRRALEIDPHLAVAQMNLGIIFRERGDTGGYVRQLQAALDSDPYCVDANLNLAEHYARAGQPDKAVPLLRNVLRVEPENREALRFLTEIVR
jgi:tetratricopeptide (TPR) repeat protein